MRLADRIDPKAWGELASTKRVTVTYRVKGQDQTVTRTMPHQEYFRWALDHQAQGYEFISAEQET